MNEFIEIHLPHGLVAIVDNQDAHLKNYKWYFGGKYVRRGAKTETGKYLCIALHHAIMGKPRNKKIQIDHINHNVLDNRRSNLRFVTARENNCNRTNNSIYPGVRKNGRKYEAKILIGKRNVYLGIFEQIKDAAEAYRIASFALKEVKE